MVATCQPHIIIMIDRLMAPDLASRRRRRILAPGGGGATAEERVSLVVASRLRRPQPDKRRLKKHTSDVLV